MFLAYGPAYAQTAPAQPATPVYSGGQAGVTQFLCTPESKSMSGTTNNALFACINQIYKFAIVVAAVVGVFFIVIAGYIYMSADGAQESVDKAKDILVSTLTCLVILFIGYVLLAAINPDLVKFNQIQQPNLTLNIPTAPTTPTTGACSNCVDLSSLNIPQKPAQGTQANSTLAAKLQSLSQKNQTWQVNEAYPPTTTHSDPCHSNGTCVDIALTVSPTTQALAQLCSDVKSVGLNVYNEYSSQITGTDSSSAAYTACGASQNPSTRTGNNLHIQ